MPLPDRLQKGHVYVDGDVVNAANLNSIVDEATALPGFISELGSASAAGADEALILKAGVLKRAAVSTFPGVGTVTHVAFTATPGTVFNDGVTGATGDVAITLELANQTAGKVLVGPVSGPDALPPSFRVLAPADMTVSTVAIPAGNTIDWSLGNVFDKTLSATPTHFTMSNVQNGQTIKVRVRQTPTGNAVVTWAATGLTIIWTDNVTPAMPLGPSVYGVFVFTAINAGGVIRVHGYLEQAEIPIGGFDPETANEFLAGPVSGPDAVPTFRAITPSDLPVGTNSLGTGSIVDCTLGNVFLKTLPVGAGPFTLHVNDMFNGQTVRIGVNQNAAGTNNVTWNTDSGTLIWRGGGTPPVVTAIGNAKDIFTFTKIDVAVYGYADQNFQV